MADYTNWMKRCVYRNGAGDEPVIYQGRGPGNTSFIFYGVPGLDEAELCRRVLVRGIAEHPDRLRARIELIEEAENHRPKCLRCGAKLRFDHVQELDNSPLQDSLLADTFDVLPAYCESCGKMEFYNPRIVNKNKYMAYLIHKDTNLDE